MDVKAKYPLDLASRIFITNAEKPFVHATSHLDFLTIEDDFAEDSEGQEEAEAVSSGINRLP